MSVFIIHGYFETLHEIASNKTLGTRECEKPESRELGEAGATTVRLTQDFTLDRGPKKKLFRASEHRPIICTSIINPICGRMTKNIHEQ
jgi:hypothetical protein